MRGGVFIVVVGGHRHKKGGNPMGEESEKSCFSK